MSRLTGIPAHADLVNLKKPRVINTDYDYKRIPKMDDTLETRAPKTVDEMRRWRKACDQLHRAGEKATPDAVHTLVVSEEFKKLHLRGGLEKSIQRVVHCALARRVKGCNAEMSNDWLADLLGISKAELSRRRHETFYYNCLANNEMVKSIIKDELAKVDIINPHQAYQSLLSLKMAGEEG